MSTTIQTKYGTATLNKHGYYWVNQNGKRRPLHRLIFEDFYNIDLNKEFPDGVHIHHIDGDRSNNEIWNLIPLTINEHSKLHYKDWNISEDSRKKQAKSLSKTTTSSGYFRVTKSRCNKCVNGVVWVYKYYDGNQRKHLSSVDLSVLKQKVLSKGLEWSIIDYEIAKSIVKEYGYGKELLE
jgi:hypothetical protein